MSKASTCPYCGHKISRVEYQRVISKVEAVVKSRVNDELSAARKALDAERKKVKLVKQSVRRDARAWADSQVERQTDHLRQEVERLKRLRAAAREDGVVTGRREVQRDLERAYSKIRGLERQLSKKTSDEFGEVSEQDLYDALRRAFPDDQFVRAQKGQEGADILHKVCYRSKVCATIAYECKNVGKWSNTYFAQARQGAEKAEASHAILVSSVFPKGAKGFTAMQGVSVVAPAGAVALARVVRDFLIEVERRGLSDLEAARKASALYSFLRGSAFRASMQGIILSVDQLQALQRGERRAHELVWRRQTEHLTGIVNRASQIQARVGAMLEGARGVERPQNVG